MHSRAVSISYETNVFFPNSPYVEKFTVMGVVIVIEYLEVEVGFVIILVLSVIKSIPYVVLSK